MSHKGSCIASAVFLSVLTSGVVAHAEGDEDVAVEEEAPKEPEGPSPREVERATAAYEDGMKHFEAEEYEDALKDFRRSYEVVKSPNSHFMVARTLARLGNNEEAYLELNRTIREADAGGERYADTATSARAKRDEIRPRIGLVTVDARALPKGSKLTLEGQPVDPQDFDDPIPVLPGNVTLVVELPDGRTVEKKVFVKTGGEKSVRLSKPRKKEEGDEETGSYIGREKHTDYIIEITLGGAYTTIEPPGAPNHGGGPSGRLAVQILPKGFLPGINDGLAVGGGADWAVSSVPSHFWFPIYVQWNFFITPELSAMLEPGISIMTEGGGVNANVMVGARYLIVGETLALTARIGIPMVQGGISALF